MTELIDLKHEVEIMRTEIIAIKSAQEFFQQTVLKDMEQRNKEQHNIYTLIDSQRTSIANIPHEVSRNMKDCQREIEKHVADQYAKQIDVVTPTTLRNILLVVTIGFSAATWVFNQIDDRSHAQQISALVDKHAKSSYEDKR